MSHIPCHYIDANNHFIYNVSTHAYPLKVVPHTHTNYELYYLLEGEVTYWVEGSCYTANPHDIFITNPKELHCPLLNTEKNYSRRFIQFEKKFIVPVTEVDYHILEPLDNRNLGCFNKVDNLYVKQYGLDHLFDTLEYKILHSDKYTHLEMQLILHQILILINRIFEQHMNDFSLHIIDEKIYAIIKYINENIANKLLVEDIARHFFMSKYYLSHFFKKHTGFSIKEYITSKRIMYAKMLIAQNMPITEVCYEVGFNDYSCFYKAFYKLEHKSPKAFLSQMCNTLK